MDGTPTRGTKMQIQASELPKQGFTGSKFDGSKIKPVKNLGYRHDKPDGGFWTATVKECGLTTWQEWCKKEMPQRFVEEYQEMTPWQDAKIFKIDGWQDLDWLWAEYGVGNWEAVARNFDAVYYTENAVWECRFGSKKYDLYGVDLESVVWFRDVFC